MAKRKNPAAVELGRLGGLVKVPKGFSSLSPEQAKENARNAAQTRWKKAKAKK